jgi:predicted ArsR family transcriptional regulator
MTKRSLRRDADAIASLREPTRQALYEYVERQPAPVSRDEAARALGLTRAVAGFHLDRLVEVDLLTADYRRLSASTSTTSSRTQATQMGSSSRPSPCSPRSPKPPSAASSGAW